MHYAILHVVDKIRHSSTRPRWRPPDCLAAQMHAAMHAAIACSAIAHQDGGQRLRPVGLHAAEDAGLGDAGVRREELHAVDARRPRPLLQLLRHKQGCANLSLSVAPDTASHMQMVLDIRATAERRESRQWVGGGASECGWATAHPHGQDGVQLGGAVHRHGRRLAHAPALKEYITSIVALQSKSCTTWIAPSATQCAPHLMTIEKPADPSWMSLLSASGDTGEDVTVLSSAQPETSEVPGHMLTPGCPSRCPQSWTRRGWW